MMDIFSPLTLFPLDLLNLLLKKTENFYILRLKTNAPPMPVQIENLTKLYYSISEVATMFNVSKSLIRFWESEFDLLRPHKNSKGDRRFTVQNIEQFRTIYHLVKERGFTLEGAKRELKLSKERITMKRKTLESLTKIRNFLENIKEEV